MATYKCGEEETRHQNECMRKRDMFAPRMLGRIVPMHLATRLDNKSSPSEERTNKGSNKQLGVLVQRENIHLFSLKVHTHAGAEISANTVRR